MTPDQLTAFAARLRDHAAMHDTGSPHDAGHRMWADDLIEAARYLRACAEAEPVATVRVHDTGGNAGIAWTAVPTENAGVMRGGTPLYTRPQPPSEQAEVANDSKWLGPFTTASEALNELRMAIATMMGCDQSTWPDHGNAPLAIAAAFAIRQTALEERAPEQDDVRAAPQPPSTQNARPLSEWHEDDGPVVWWLFPVHEPAWIGTPLDDGWPGYHTHWTPHPKPPERER